jgi:hypothetical protein
MVEQLFLTLEQAYLKASGNGANLDQATFLTQVRTYHGQGKLKITGVPVTRFSLSQLGKSPPPPLMDGMRQEISPDYAVAMEPCLNREGKGFYTDGIIRLVGSRPSFSWHDIFLEADAVNRLWPPQSEVEPNLEAILNAEIKKFGYLSQADAEKIARARGVFMPREKIRDLLKTLLGSVGIQDSL